MQSDQSLAAVKSQPCTEQQILLWVVQTFSSGIKWRTVGQKHILEVRNDALDHCIAAGISMGLLACSASLSVSFCIWALGMWPEQQVDLKQYKWACLSKALDPPRSLKCLGERMAAHIVPVCLLPWLGTACFALLCGRTVNLGCVEAGEASWEIFKDYIVAGRRSYKSRARCRTTHEDPCRVCSFISHSGWS